MTTNPRYQVRISHDGQLHIDNERQVIPDGVDPSQVVIQTLHIDAAGNGMPVHAAIRDDRSDSHFDMMVMPDGTTQAPGSEAAPAPLPAEPKQSGSLFERLVAAQAAGRAHDFDAAIFAADGILQELAGEQGDTAPATLKAAQFRADLAYLSGDYAFATASWTWLALAWFDRLGPGKRLTQIAAQNAAQAWMQLPLNDAVAQANELLSMLLEVVAPERTESMRFQIEQRLQQGTT
ncbi:hypothetical protein [Streptomyces lydicus]|uniref:hypothetical protein n=1 Tax=Streptomyces lydicus TaxID=47763 RepID=UPI001012C04B|nr:hypothetical protein [Streptomyces lydicus]MCZ1012284.1 hypothetical protein [Streptomyces lydicus]